MHMLIYLYTAFRSWKTPQTSLPGGARKARLQAQWTGFGGLAEASSARRGDAYVMGSGASMLRWLYIIHRPHTNETGVASS